MCGFGAEHVVEPIFVEPHYDDVALSCGGFVSQEARTGSPLILTVFGGEPQDLNLSDFASKMHDDWGLSPAEAVGRRRAESACATTELGAAIRTTWLPFQDAIYRDHRYDSDAALFGTVLDGDELINSLAVSIAEVGEGPFYVPMGVGNHVDHQIVFEAAKMMAADGRQVYCYPDLPYALNRQAFLNRWNAVRWESDIVVQLDAGDFERKWRAIQCFTSQLPVIFAEFDDPRRRFEDFHHSLTDGGLAERFWRMPVE